ncbi:TonB-dependent receptor [Orbaceae bacterium ac157xtp]
MSKKMKLAILATTVKASILMSIPVIAVANSHSDMDTIVVTASGFSQQIKDAPATISVLTKEDLENKPYRDVTDAIKDLPGVNITGSGDSTDISIRGMDAKYTLIMVDGKKVSSREARPNSDGPGFEQGWLPPLSAIERIEVVRGPMSSLYGSDAMGGVINIITKKVADKWQGNLRMESIIQEDSKYKNYYNSSFSVMGPVIDDVLGVKLYGQYSDRGEDEFVEGHAEQKLKSLRGNLALNATESQLFELDFGRALQTSSATVGKTRKPSRGNFKRDDRHNSFALTHKGVWDAFSTTTSVSHEDTKNASRNMRIKNTEANTQLLIPLESNTLTLGGKYAYHNLHDAGNEFVTISKIDRWDYALFAENEWQLLDSLALTGGLRFNKDENFGSHWNPRIYGVWNINENYTLKGGYTSGYSTPQLRWVVSDWGQVTGGPGGNAVIIGNPNLKPEKSNNYEIGLGYSNDSGLNASATAFYTKFKDKIESYYICQSGSCVLNGHTYNFIQGRENVDKATIKGVELTLKTPLFEHVSLSSNYAYSHSEQKSGKNRGKPLNKTPKHNFNSQLDWTLNEQWSLWGKVTFHGKEIETGRGSKAAGKEYASYTFWDIGADYAINKETSLYAGIYNLFDKKIDYQNFSKSIDGRRYWVGVDINF